MISLIVSITTYPYIHTAQHMNIISNPRGSLTQGIKATWHCQCRYPMSLPAFSQIFYVMFSIFSAQLFCAFFRITDNALSLKNPNSRSVRVVSEFRIPFIFLKLAKSYYMKGYVYACVKGHLEPTHLKSSPLFTFSKKIISSRFTISSPLFQDNWVKIHHRENKVR